MTGRASSPLQDYIGKIKLFSRNVQMVLLYSALTGLTFGVFRLLFNFYVLSLGGYDERFLGLLTSLSSAASLLMALPAAYIAERFSRKRIMVITGIISGLAFLGLVLVPIRGFLIFFNIISGIAASTRQVAVSPFLMSNTTNAERQYVFSFNQGMVTVASFLGNMFGGMLPSWFGGLVNAAPTATISYRLALVSMMAIALLAVAPLALIAATPPDRSRKIDLPWQLFWQHGRQLTRLILPNWIIGLGAGMMMPFMNLYYRNVFNKEDSIIGYLFASGALAMSLAQFIAPPIADRIGKINTTVLTQVLSVPFLISLGLAAWAVPRGGNATLWFVIAWAAYLFRLALMNMGGPVYTTFILEQVPENVQALAASLTGIAFQFGWVLSPQLSGWFQTNYGFVPVFLTTSGLYIVGIAVTWIFFHDAERKYKATALLTADSSTLGD
nr:MFS transporter [Anaerolineae bacterium]